MAKTTKTLYHPLFPDTTREIEGAEEIKRYTDQGWLDKKPSTPKIEEPAAPAAPATTPAPAAK